MSRTIVASLLLVIACSDPGRVIPPGGVLPTDGGPPDGGSDLPDSGPPLAPMGGACRRDADCAAVPGTARCLTEAAAAAAGLTAPAGVCTSDECNTQTPAQTCGLATTCADVRGDGTPTCAMACATRSDCRSGYFCVAGACTTQPAAAPEGGYPTHWGLPVPLPELNSASADWLSSLSNDLLRVCFASERDSPGTLHIYCAERNSLEVPFSAPRPQTAINSNSSDAHPFLWRNEIYFNSDRDGSHEIYRAVWNPTMKAFVNPTRIAALSSPGNDGAPSLTPDGLTIYFHSDRPGGLGQHDIWRATRPSLSAPFGTPTNVTSLNSSSNEWFPTAAGDGSFLTLTSDRPGGHPMGSKWIARAGTGGEWQTPVPVPMLVGIGWEIGDIRPLANGWLIGSRAVPYSGDLDVVLLPPSTGPKPPTTEWGTPVPITELNQPGTVNTSASMTADRLRICFLSNRPGGLGNADLWCASRTSVTAPFGAPVNQAAINTTGAEAAPGLSPDGSELFFVAARNGGSTRLWRSFWNSAAGTYGAPMEANGPGDSNVSATLSSDGLNVLYTAQPNHSGYLKLAYATRPRTSAAFMNPTLIDALNAQMNIGDMDPFLAPDGFTLLFLSGRPAPGDSSGLPYLWVSGWDGKGGWSTPVPATVGGVSPVKAYHASVLSDGSLLFHSSSFGPTGGLDELYIAPPLDP